MALKITVLALSLFFLSCPTNPPDFISEARVSYYYNYNSPHWDGTSINIQEQWFIQQVSTRISGYSELSVRHSLSMANVYVYPSSFTCVASPTGKCAGDEDYEYLSVVYFKCPGDSALTHEMAHWLEYDIKGITDYNHTVEPELWIIADSAAPGDCTQ